MEDEIRVLQRQIVEKKRNINQGSKGGTSSQGLFEGVGSGVGSGLGGGGDKSQIDKQVKILESRLEKVNSKFN